MNKKRKNLWIIAVITLVVAAIILLVLTKGNTTNGIEVETANPIISTITENIPANGKIQPITEVKISPDVSGEIIELNFEEGDIVKRGDLIIKIKQDVYISLVERAEASLNSAKAAYIKQQARLTQTELTFERNKKLFQEGAISESQYEQFESELLIAREELKSAEYNIESAEAGQKEAKENLDKTTIYAPMNGIISLLSVEKGERVVGTSQMAGTEMLRIADFSEMEVRVDVNENDIIRIADMDTTEINVDAYPNKKFYGVVTHIANSAKNIGSNIDQVTNFEVKIKILPESYSDLLQNSATAFKPGMSASVQIRTDIKSNILTIPLKCITTRSDIEGEDKDAEYNEFVFVLDKETSTVKPIQIVSGIQDINSIEVISGLTENDIIISGPYEAINKILIEGSLVNISEENE